jgi:hypothetical protein
MAWLLHMRTLLFMVLHTNADLMDASIHRAAGSVLLPDRMHKYRVVLRKAGLLLCASCSTQLAQN